MKKRNKQIAVIGAGIIGSWTALHLAEMGISTTLYEQFPLPHTRGSSHGQSRAFRFLGELEMARLDYSLQRWNNLEKSSGEQLFVKTGLLNFGLPGDPDLKTFMDVLSSAGRTYEWLSGEEIARRYPMIHYPKEWGAAWDPSGGLLIAYRCLTKVQEKFIQLGGRVVCARVLDLDREENGSWKLNLHDPLASVSNEQVFEKVVICCGPWTAQLIPHLKEHLKVVHVPVTYWRDIKGAYSASSGFPIIFNARMTNIYGLPACEYPNHVKLLFHGGPVTDPDVRNYNALEPYITEVSRYVEEHLPHIDPKRPSILETCMYTETADGFPIIDRLDSGLIVGCGFSGSGFKHSPATGLMLASMAGNEDQLILEDFEPDRYKMRRFKSI